MKNGYYLYLSGNEYFLVTNQKYITDKLALEFINHIQNYRNEFYNITQNAINIIKRKIIKATLATRTTPSGYSYIDIFGDNFGGYGDNNTVIFE